MLEQAGSLTLEPIATNLDLELAEPHWLQKHILLVVIYFLRRFRQRKGSVLMLTSRLCVKYGRRIDLTEARTMEFVGRSSSIPIPKVFFAFTHKNCTYILMERIQGQPLGRKWFERSEASRAKVLADLRRNIEELRKLGPQSNAIGSVTGGSLYDPRIPSSTRRFGPFQTVGQFHEHLRHGIQHHSSHHPDVNRLIELHNQQWGAPTFTHGDLSSLNILAHGDDIVGIVDWETAGWYPSYWEYTAACQVNPQNEFWGKEIEGFLEPMPKALQMERLRQQYFGNY